MNKVCARFFDGNSSRGSDVEVELIENSGVRFAIQGKIADFPIDAISIECPVGDSGYLIHLPNNAVLHVDRSDQLENWCRPFASTGMNSVSLIERRWSYAIAALVIVIATGWWSLTSGIPIVAKYLAKAMPQEIEFFVSQQGMNLLDHEFFGESELDPLRQQQIGDLFASIFENTEIAERLTLLFRKGNILGANAFALPSGTIVITDELVEMAEHDEEIIAILAHEVGHIDQQHSIRMLLQSSGSAALFVVLTGDFGSAALLGSSIPTVLVNNAYSREFETEADDYAYRSLDSNGISRHRFADILLRLEQEHGGGDDSAISGFLSSHPRTGDRINGPRPRQNGD